MPPRAAAVTKASWDSKQQSQVVRAGLMAKLPGGFHGERPLTSAQLRLAFTAISAKNGTPTAQVSSAPISVTRFDSLLAGQLGLSASAQAFQAEAQRVGLKPPSYFGTEVVARLLGLHYEPPVGRRPARALPVGPHHPRRGRLLARPGARSSATGRPATCARARLASSSPTTTPRSSPRSSVAVSKIGMPYVWGGETDGPRYGQVHGGYDCSGFVWRVFKVSGNPRRRARSAAAPPRSRRARSRSRERVHA